MLREGEVDIKRLAAIEGVQAAYISRVVRLTFLSPAVVDGMLAGSQAPQVDVATLTRADAIPAVWSEQAEFMPAAGR